MVVANMWNQFGEVEILSLLLPNKPEPKTLCETVVHGSICYSIQFLCYCSPPEAPRSQIANSDQTHRSTTSRVNPPLDYLCYLATDFLCYW